MIKESLVIGLRVVLNEKSHHELVGKAGTIVEIDGEIAGIELDEMLYLHDCNGKCKPGYGWYEKAEAIDEESSSPICRLIEKDKDLIKNLRTSTLFDFKNETYAIKKNGALIILEKCNQKVIAVNTVMGVMMFLKCQSETDAIVCNHLLEAYGIAEMKSIKNNGERFELVAYTQAEFDACEKRFQEVPPTVEEITAKAEPNQEEPKAVEFQTEEELYKSLGITL